MGQEMSIKSLNLTNSVIRTLHICTFVHDLFLFHLLVEPKKKGDRGRGGLGGGVCILKLNNEDTSVQVTSIDTQ